MSWLPNVDDVLEQMNVAIPIANNDDAAAPSAPIPIAYDVVALVPVAQAAPAVPAPSVSPHTPGVSATSSWQHVPVPIDASFDDSLVDDLSKILNVQKHEEVLERKLYHF